MKAVIIGVVLFGVIVLAGFWELRREWRKAGEKLNTLIHAERPAEDCADALDDALTTGVITPDTLDALIEATREDPAWQFVPGVPCDAEISVWMDRWTAEQEGR